MAAFFRDFSFAAASSLPAADLDEERAAMNPSPTTSPSRQQLPSRRPSPPPMLPPTMVDLTAAFDQQSLRILPDESLTPPGDELTFPGHSYDSCPRRPVYSRIDSATLRMQRQANVRMQCNAAHAKDIAVLVQSMIESSDQCNVCEPKSRSSSSASSTMEDDEDEAVDMEYDPAPAAHFSYALNYRRSGERVAGCATVSKAARMRKKSRITKRSSR